MGLYLILKQGCSRDFVSIEFIEKMLVDFVKISLAVSAIRRNKQTKMLKFDCLVISTVCFVST